MNKAYGIWCLRNKCGATSSAAAAIEPGPAFLSRGNGHIVVPVAERRLRLIGELNRRSATGGGCTVTALKSRAKLTRSLHDRVDGCRKYSSKAIWHITYAIVFLALASLPAFAQQRPLITEDVVTVKPGVVRFEAGFDFLQDKDYPVSGLNGDLARLGVVSLTFGLASNVEVEAGGVIQNFLNINRRFRPSAVPLQLNQAHSTRGPGG